jgi:HAD superfamily hydrolase (TIGR01549 family)
MKKSSRPPVEMICFDFGFTLWSEERAWSDWAQWLGISTLEFFPVLGSVIERGEPYQRAFETFKPGIDLAQERHAQKEAGLSVSFRPDELYSDVLPSLKDLRAAGYRLSVAGNYFAEFATGLREMNLPLEFIGSSDEWNMTKPSPEFFDRIGKLSGLSPSQIAYVGDRVDNDVLPSKAAGMTSVFLRRGPWGLIHAKRPEAGKADIRIDSLRELKDALEKWLTS